MKRSIFYIILLKLSYITYVCLSQNEQQTDRYKRALVIYDILPTNSKTESIEFLNNEECEKLTFFDYCIFKEAILKDIKSYYKEKNKNHINTTLDEKIELFDNILSSLNKCIEIKEPDFSVNYFYNEFRKKSYGASKIIEEQMIKDIGETSYKCYSDLKKIPQEIDICENDYALEYIIEVLINAYYRFIKHHDANSFKILYPSFIREDYRNDYYKDLPVVNNFLKNFTLDLRPKNRFVKDCDFELMLKSTAIFINSFSKYEKNVVCILFTSINFVYKHHEKLWFGIQSNIGKEKNESSDLNKTTMEYSKEEKINCLHKIVKEIIEETITSKDNVSRYLEIIKKREENVLFNILSNKISPKNKYWFNNKIPKDENFKFIMDNIDDAFFSNFMNFLDCKEIVISNKKQVDAKYCQTSQNETNHKSNDMNGLCKGVQHININKKQKNKKKRKSNRKR